MPAVVAASHETQPLLQNSNSETPPLSGGANAIIAEHPQLTGDDPDNPLQWTATFKWGTVLLLACTAFTITITCFSIVPLARGIIEDLDTQQQQQHSKTASVLLVTTWELGEATGPFLIAPLSELFGRKPVMNTCNIALIACTLLASFATSAPWITAMRFLSGMSVAANVLNPAILGDIFEKEDLGTAMSLVMLAPLLGGAIGPVMGGAVATRCGWRTTLRLCAVGLGVCEILFVRFFKETFVRRIGVRKRSKFCQAGRKKRLGSSSFPQDDDDDDDDDDRVAPQRLLLEYLVRPFVVLWSSSLLQAMSLFASLAFAYYYTILTTLPTIMQDSFHQTEAQIGLAFIPLSIGDLTSVLICNQFLDRIYIHLRRRKHKNPTTSSEPEYRLPLAILGAILLPLAITSYGWASYSSIPILRAVLVLLGLSILTSSIPSTSFIVEAFGEFSASAMTAMVVSKSLMGALLPLAIGAMIRKLDYGITFTIWGGVSLFLIPVPVLCMRYGAKLRLRSEYTRGC